MSDEIDDGLAGPYGSAIPADEQRQARKGRTSSSEPRNRGGRPPTRHFKKLFAALEPFSAAFLEVDKRVIGERNGAPVTVGDTLMRKLATMAAKDKGMMALYLEAARDAHERDAKVRGDFIMAAQLHKEKYGPMFQLAERRGRPLPNVFPHPDDIIIGRDGMPEIKGPTSREEADAVNILVKRQEQIVDGLKIIIAGTDEASRTDDFQLWKKLRREFYRINPPIPPRLRRKFPKFPDHRGAGDND